MSDDFDDEKTPERASGVPAAELPKVRSTPVPHRRPKAAWGDEQRIEAGAQHRRASTENMTASERRRRGHPVVPDHVERELGGAGPHEIEPDITQPWAMLDREHLKPDEQEIINRSKRESDSPVYFGDLAKVTALQFRQIKQLFDDRSARKEQADAILELIKHPPNEAVTELQEDVQRLWRAVAEIGKQIGTPHTESKDKGTVWESVHRSQILHRWGLRLAGVALTAALGAGGYVVASIRSSGAEEALRSLDRQSIKDLQQENRELRRQFERLKDKTP